MLNILQLLSVLSAGLFAGAAVYIELVEHPARLEGESLNEFRASYKRGAKFMGALLNVASLAALGAWVMASRAWWLVAALLLLSLIPFTLAVIMPINRMLLDPGRDLDAGIARKLLVRWGRLHAIRCLVGVASFFLLLYLMFGEAGLPAR